MIDSVIIGFVSVDFTAYKKKKKKKKKKKIYFCQTN